MTGKRFCYSMWKERYNDCLSYIDAYWDKVTVYPTNGKHKKKILPLMHVGEKRNKHAIEVPYPFLVPNDKHFSFVFYWDTFFIFRGLIQTKHEWILQSMVDNFLYLFKRYHLIPNFNSHSATGHSQPPFFTSMILDTYNGYYFSYLGRKGTLKRVRKLDRYKKWLNESIALAKEEYWNTWIDKNRIFHHSVEGYSLNRYGDTDIGYAHSSELESGWDFTSRFYNRCDEFLPIDLNVYLFKYERDFAKIAAFLDDKKEQEFWNKLKEERKVEINRLMWDEKKGFFFDYGYVNKKISDFLSLAGFTPLWAGFASEEQAQRMVKMLPIFETEHGLVIAAKESLAPQVDLSNIPERFRPAIEEVIRPKQWDYPNIWPPLEYLTVVGLLKYGFINDAKRIMEKSVQTHAKIFRKYQTFFEKIDGVSGDKPNDFHYSTQTGFGWTNAVFYRYVQILDTIESGEDIYLAPKAKTPPYKLIIPH